MHSLPIPDILGSVNLTLVGCCLVTIPPGAPASLMDFLVFGHSLSFVIPRPCLGAGIRFGEALNPGPGDAHLIRFCVTNPTCVSKKFSEYSDLFARLSCHFVSLSETAAAEVVQKKLSRQLRTP